MLVEWTLETERKVQSTRTSIVTMNPPTDPPSSIAARQEQNNTITSPDTNKTTQQWQ